MDSKLSWEGTVTSVQPRIRLMRSFDQRQHEYLGYVLRLDGNVAGDSRAYSIAIGKGAHEKHGFRVGDRLTGSGVLVPAPEREIAEIYRVSGIKLLARSDNHGTSCAPEPPHHPIQQRVAPNRCAHGDAATPPDQPGERSRARPGDDGRQRPVGVAEPHASRAQPGQDHFGRVSHRGVTWVSLPVCASRQQGLRSCCPGGLAVLVPRERFRARASCSRAPA